MRVRVIVLKQSTDLLKNRQFTVEDVLREYVVNYNESEGRQRVARESRKALAMGQVVMTQRLTD